MALHFFQLRRPQYTAVLRKVGSIQRILQISTLECFRVKIIGMRRRKPALVTHDNAASKSLLMRACARKFTKLSSGTGKI